MACFHLLYGTQKKNSLHLVRDRLGKKPLFFRKWKNHFVFGSRLDAIEALTDNVKLSCDALSWLLTLKYIPDPFCVSDKIFKVPSGHFLQINGSKPKLVRWYKSFENCYHVGLPIDSQRENLKSLIHKAVEKRLVSDVPIASFLSGGIDSTIVSYIANKYRAINTFTVGFDDQQFDETKAARETATYLGTSHHEVHLRENDLLDYIDQLFTSALDEPFGDSSALPSFFVSKAIKDYATVALSGDGADEIFGGYRKYQGELAAIRWQSLPKPVKYLIRSIIRSLPDSRATRTTDLFRQLKRFIHGAELSDVDRHVAWMGFASYAHDIQKFLNQDSHKKISDLISNLHHPSFLDPLSLTLYRDTQTVLISDMLVKVDRTSMFSGVEVRSPFLDHEVVEMAMSIPGDQKIAWGQGKKILRQAFGNELPKQIFQRSKKGFEIPLNKWLTGPLNGRMKKAISVDFLEYNQLNKRLSNILQNGVARGSLAHAEFCWTLMSIYSWQEARGFE